ncbi:hypothetical protein MUU53_12395 [Rhizobium lemnae]|uniref:Uncharacterized protein n=1 Tax=Rhizobium lemnae TaxID=1214924 RepID=A0ABV8EAQ1_9HYPH|nr:hypothetical protein [Rhizobium lemnae]MCJ8508711.1 hypothetical protein [Rhizobium lemnae]
MALITSDMAEQLEDRSMTETTHHPLRPVFVAVLALKIAVASLLIGAAAFAPSVSAEGSYFVSE